MEFWRHTLSNVVCRLLSLSPLSHLLVCLVEYQSNAPQQTSPGAAFTGSICFSLFNIAYVV